MSLLIIVSSPSGGGKTTAVNGLLARNPQVRRAITCTTRAPRPGEIKDVDYHFFSPEEFARRKGQGEFLESAIVHGNLYGSLWSSVRDAMATGQDIVLAIDVQGASSIRHLAGNDPTLAHSLVTVFLMPPSIDVLEKRLRNRKTDSEEVIQRRLANAREEMAHAPEYQHVFTSLTIESDITHLQQIVQAERKKRGG